MKRFRNVSPSGSVALCVDAKSPASSGVRKMPRMLESDALKMAAGTFPRATAVIATEEEIVDGIAPRK